MALAMIFSSSILISCDEDNGSLLDQLTGLTPANDVQMGIQVSGEIANDPNTYPILSESEYPEAYTYIRSMTTTILASDEINHKDIFHYDEVKIIQDDNTLNAFATPGGFIYVYTGLIKYLDKADDLAGVMGHEIAHASQRHSSGQMQKNMGLALLTEIILGDGQAADLAAGFFSLTFSRSDESESDEYSVLYLGDTDYACNGAASFFEKISASGQSQTPVFLSTHPSPDSRVEDINAKASSEGCNTEEISETAMTYAQFKASLP